MKNSIIKQFGLINTIEGYSYLALLFIAMPMKYLLGFSMAVKVVGMTHGVLFIMFLTLGLMAWKQTRWSLNQTIVFFLASLIPFGTFFTKSKIASYENTSINSVK